MKPNDRAWDWSTFWTINSCLIDSDCKLSSRSSNLKSSPYTFLNLCIAVFAAIWISDSVTSSPLIDPKEPVNTDESEDVPKNTKGNAQTMTTKISLGPVKKFLSDSIIMAIL